ncbi:MAG: hypothetical protein COX81_02345 [Candidatus Magasanikbacteria bacterium CG_4_10_14_0_2_um_filter_37_12]|uniref:Branched-chain amino acid aminotransferase n=1 Tax=Candidatus Magasanikbacteria bacterium CG_4_10_14_0_2_um_filter_37_12 TaxID=1974637 RepID=A0A2M7V819_9BACT|nr:MAG: hypothetical protein COX81_02345 [Candidatus Magasanikbacteria bacterium CG_4_10_14_0_2_um_filter_37_12]
MNKQFSILNGNLIPSSEATIPISDKGYFFDFAVYDSLKIIQGKLFFPEFHIDRLLFSADQIGLKHHFDKKQIIKWINLLVEKNNLANYSIRTILIGDPDNGKQPKLYIFPVTGITYAPNECYSKGIKTISCVGQRRFPQAKTVDLLLAYTAKRTAKQADAKEVLMVDYDGFICEGGSSNFLAIQGDKLITPPREKCLEGITKKIILEIAKNNFEIIEKDILLTDLKNYDEFFITSTLKNVMPIRQIDDLVVTDKFPQTKKIMKLYKDYYTKNILNN